MNEAPGFIFVFVALLIVSPRTAGAADGTKFAQKLVHKLAWRNIGPFIGGRVVAVAGVPSDRNLFYFCGVQGGVWRSTDYGNGWMNISDGKIRGTAQTIGALAVGRSNSYEKPTGTEYATFDDLEAEALAGKRRLQQLMVVSQ